MEDRAPGARKGARKAARPRRARGPAAPLLLVGAAASLTAWGGLVLAAIRFGQSGRGGDALAWLFLAIASLGAVACLFLALVLGSKALRALGPGRDRASGPSATKSGKRPAGKRVAPRH